MGYKFNPFTGNFDIVGEGGGSSSPDNFSYQLVASGQTVVVPPGQLMLVDGPIRVLGHLDVQGDVRDISNRQPEKFFYDLIDTGEVVKIYPNRLLLYQGHLTVLGHLRVNGRLGVVA